MNVPSEHDEPINWMWLIELIPGFALTGSGHVGGVMNDRGRVLIQKGSGLGWGVQASVVDGPQCNATVFTRRQLLALLVDVVGCEINTSECEWCYGVGGDPGIEGAECQGCGKKYQGEID